jgi:hypothetical protein
MVTLTQGGFFELRVPSTWTIGLPPPFTYQTLAAQMDKGTPMVWPSVMAYLPDSENIPQPGLVFQVFSYGFPGQPADPSVVSKEWSNRLQLGTAQEFTHETINNVLVSTTSGTMNTPSTGDVPFVLSIARAEHPDAYAVWALMCSGNSKRTVEDVTNTCARIRDTFRSVQAQVP